MTVSGQTMLQWLRGIFGEGREELSLSQYLERIPRLESLADVPSGTPVLIRGDTDCKPGASVGDGDVRLRSMKSTLEFGRSRGWKQIIFGHVGRDPAQSLNKVARRLGEILNLEVPLLTDWFDSTSASIDAGVTSRIGDSPAGSVFLLENTRAYEMERVLWKAKLDDLPKSAEYLAKVANEFAAKLAGVYIHEAFSAGSLDTSSVVVPAAMNRVALGAYERGQLEGPMLQCLRAELVIFSGLKADKLDDMEAIIRRGHVRMLFCAGSLAMAVKKADAQLAGSDFHLGVSEDLGHADKPYYVPPKRIEQAKRMLQDGRKAGIEFVLPVDFVLEDGTAADRIGPGRQQFDIGPKSTEHFANKIDEFIQRSRGARVVAFHNGVFGMFEDPRFESGTREFTRQLKKMKDAGIEVFVGGGEGGAALERYGQTDWITHCFTAGGTVLNALGADPIPYLVALCQAVK
jgi:phosphoglycerate kinase